MAWLWSTRGADPAHLPKVGVADVNAYLRFLEAPAREPLTAEALRAFGFKAQPFRVEASLAASSIGQALVILHGMFEAMRNLRAGGGRPYIELNPFRLARKAKGRSRGREAERALSAAECEALDATIEALPRLSVEERAVYHRARWLVALLVRSWFRRSEVARLVMGDFHRDPHGDGWVCTVETKGGEDHTIVVTSQLLRELQVYRVFLGLSALPLPHDTLPAVGHLQSRDRHLTADMVYKIVKELVNSTANRLAASEHAGEPEVALMVERLRSVSPHRFRHTGVTRALESGTDPRYAQAQAGHASLATTMIYDHKDMRRQREQLERVR